MWRQQKQSVTDGLTDRQVDVKMIHMLGFALPAQNKLENQTGCCVTKISATLTNSGKYRLSPL